MQRKKRSVVPPSGTNGAAIKGKIPMAEQSLLLGSDKQKDFGELVQKMVAVLSKPHLPERVCKDTVETLRHVAKNKGNIIPAIPRLVEILQRKDGIDYKNREVAGEALAYAAENGQDVMCGARVYLGILERNATDYEPSPIVETTRYILINSLRNDTLRVKAFIAALEGVGSKHAAVTFAYADIIYEGLKTAMFGAATRENLHRLTELVKTIQNILHSKEFGKETADNSPGFGRKITFLANLMEKIRDSMDYNCELLDFAGETVPCD